VCPERFIHQTRVCVFVILSWLFIIKHKQLFVLKA